MRTMLGHKSTSAGSVLLLCVGAVVLVAGMAVAAEAPEEEWTRQFGSDRRDEALAVAVADSGVYVTGYTAGVLPGQTGLSGYDVFVRKYDTAGNVEWTDQFGTRGNDVGYGIAVDESGVYVAGVAHGKLPGQTRLSTHDAFLRKYDTAGNVVWTRQFGTEQRDYGRGVAADEDGVYVVGETWGRFPGQTKGGDWGQDDPDVFIRKYDPDGNVVWTRQPGTEQYDYGNGIAVNASGVYVTGSTEGAFRGQTNAGESDVFVRKHDLAGDFLWTRQFGTAGDDGGWSVAAGAGSLYITGGTEGVLPGQTSAGRFLRKYDKAGTEEWTFPSDGRDVAVHTSGIYATGLTSSGYTDVIVRMYNTAGSVVWTDQFGSAGTDRGEGVAVDASGVYVTGRVGRALPGQPYAGSSDAFVRKYRHRCMGLPVTIGGTDASETLVGTPGDDVIHGWGGDDVLIGGGGKDVICGGEGNDLLHGKAGDDRLGGGPGNDKLNGGLGDDALNGGGGKDQAVYYAAAGGAQVDLLAGTATGHGSDTLTRIEHVMGSPANDMLRGDKHRNVLKGLAGDDVLYGKAGDDVLYGGDGIDTLKGGPDHDECTRGEVYESCEVIR